MVDLEVDKLAWFLHDFIVFVEPVGIIKVTICKLLFYLFVGLVLGQLRRTVFFFLVLIKLISVGIKYIDDLSLCLLVYCLLDSLYLIF